MLAVCSIQFSYKDPGCLDCDDLLDAHSGGHYAGVDTLKMRLLPWLGTCFSMARPCVTDDTSLQLIQVTLLTVLRQFATRICDNVVLKSFKVAVFAVIRIQQRRTEGSGSSLSLMAMKCTSWTVNCAPPACSWKLSEQSESEPDKPEKQMHDCNKM